MRLNSIRALGFRNLNGGDGKALELTLENGVNILAGSNAQGKTNLIEAVYFCAMARSQRTSSDRELIRFGEDTAYLSANVTSRVYGDSTLDNRIDVALKHSGKTGVAKGVAVNGIPIGRLGDLLGILCCVIFSPEDLKLIKSGPGERRRFIDMELCQVSKVYYYELRQYYKALKQRNSLLKDMQKKGAQKNGGLLEVWDEQLAQSGVKIAALRRKYIEKISVIAAEIHKTIANEAFSALYRPSIPGEDKEAFLERLRKNRERDILLGVTGAGVHKDDAGFFIDGMDSRIYGSQGQQRTAALSLKLAEVEMIKSDMGESPLLLLDDVLSELDAKRQECLISAIGGIQTVITCTGAEGMLRERMGGRGDTAFYTVKNGEINRNK